MTPGAILLAAKELVEGPRAKAHGNYEENFKVIAALWSVYLDTEVTPRDVAHLMALLKIGRDLVSPGNGDNAIDAAGYEAIAGALE